MMTIKIISLFPEVLWPVLNSSMMRKAQEQGLVSFEVIDLRRYGLGLRRKVDDTPYGGGDGMLLMIEPIYKAIFEAKKNLPKAQVVLLTPHGELWKQEVAQSWVGLNQDYIFLCAHYEGYDERVTEFVDKKIRIGDYILTGGELPALTVIDSLVRLIPGVLGGEKSAEIESFSHGDNLEFPQYTRPREFHGLVVPEVLLNGNHAEIEQWRRDHSSSLKTQGTGTRDD